MKRFMLGLLSVLLALAMGSTVWAQQATVEATPEIITLIPHQDAAFGIDTVVPDGWKDAGNGIFTSPSGATTLIAQQATPLKPDAVLTALEPQLALTQTPTSVGTYQGTALDWTLYQVDVTAGSISVKVDLALANANDKTYVVLLQAPPEQYQDLHTSVFLPTLDAFAPLTATATEEAVPYNSEDVTFKNGDVTLAGTLTLPPTSGRHPVVVLVTGSGPQDRDEALGGGIALKPFAVIADAFTRAGVAVLRYDDRGVGASTGDFASATTADFASDAAAAIDYLRTRDDINPDQIGLLGHSEGGLVAAMLGASDPKLDFIISMAGPAVSGQDVITVQNQRIMQAEGAPQAQIDAQLAFVNQLIAEIDDPQAMETLIYNHALEQAQALPADQQAALGDLQQYAHSVTTAAMQQYGTSWFKAFLAYDPGPDWAKTTIPVLALYGGKDTQVDAVQNAPALGSALAKAGNKDYEIVVLPDANHLFQSANTGAPTEYATLPAQFTPNFLPTIINWLQAHVTITS